MYYHCSNYTPIILTLSKIVFCHQWTSTTITIIITTTITTTRIRTRTPTWITMDERSEDPQKTWTWTTSSVSSKIRLRTTISCYRSICSQIITRLFNNAGPIFSGNSIDMWENRLPIGFTINTVRGDFILLGHFFCQLPLVFMGEQVVPSFVVDMPWTKFAI